MRINFIARNHPLLLIRVSQMHGHERRGHALGEEALEDLGDGAEGELRLHLAVGATQVAHEHNRGAWDRRVRRRGGWVRCTHRGRGRT